MNDTISTPLTKLLQIDFPVIQGGMVWCSGAKLAASVSLCGGLGLLGAGSMNAELLRQMIQNTKSLAEKKTFGVNLPLVHIHAKEQMEIILREKPPVVVTSAGSPKLYTKALQAEGILVGHVVPSVKLALKCQEQGVDFIIAEGFEAGGHNGIEETTTLVLCAGMKKAKLTIPWAVAGGVATGHQIFGLIAMGAHGVQIGTLFAASEESSAHKNFKQAICCANEGDTVLTLKKVIPTRLKKNGFVDSIFRLEETYQDTEENLQKLLGHGRAKSGIFEGDLEEGEIEIGQISAFIKENKTVFEIFTQLRSEFSEAKKSVTVLA